MVTVKRRQGPFLKSSEEATQATQLQEFRHSNFVLRVSREAVYTAAGAVAISGRSSATLLAPRGRPIVRALILSCRRITPSISASGRGGQPGTYTSTGTT